MSGSKKNSSRDEEVTEVKEADPVKAPVTPKRTYSNNMELDSDLFKLKIGNMKKNVGYHEKKPIFADVEHCHFFRTIDSSGRDQVKSSFVGGHTHAVNVSVDEKGKFIGKCGPATGGKIEGDQHVHEIIYIRSDKIFKRKFNEDAQISISNRSKI